MSLIVEDPRDPPSSEENSAKSVPATSQGTPSRSFLSAIMMMHDCVAVVILAGLIITRSFDWTALALFAGMFGITILGTEVGLHRLFSHRAFVARLPVKILLGVAGATGLQGSILMWATVHRRHHRFSDRPGDPHSPNLYGATLRDRLRGAWFVHTTAQLSPQIRELGVMDLFRYSRDLLRDPVVTWIDRYYYLWVVLGIVAPGALAFAIVGTGRAAALGALWGGPIRILATHHVTWAVNSVGHLSSARPFETSDGSANIWWLAPVTMGGAWHNNHHAFPSFARAGLSPWQLDPGYWFIVLLQRLHLVYNVRLPVAGSEVGGESLP